MATNQRDKLTDDQNGVGEQPATIEPGEPIGKADHLVDDSLSGPELTDPSDFDDAAQAEALNEELEQQASTGPATTGSGFTSERDPRFHGSADAPDMDAASGTASQADQPGVGDDPLLESMLGGQTPDVATGPDTTRFGDGASGKPSTDPFAERQDTPGFTERVGSVGDAPFSADQFPGKHTHTDSTGTSSWQMGGDGGVGSGADPSGSGSTDSGAGTAAGAVVAGTVSDIVHGSASANPVQRDAARDYLKGMGYEGVDDMSDWELRRNVDFEAERARVDGGSTKPSSYTEDQYRGEGSEQIDQHRAELRAMQPTQSPQDDTIDPASGDVAIGDADAGPPQQSGIENPDGSGRTRAPVVDDGGPQSGVIDPVESEGGPPTDGPWSDAPDVGLDGGPIDVGIDAEPDGYFPPMAAEEPYDDPAAEGLTGALAADELPEIADM